MPISAQAINNMNYVDFMAFLDETNRPPGGKKSIALLVQNAFIQPIHRVLDVGCNTGYCTFEIAHIAGCSVTGVDLNRSMIKRANERLQSEPSAFRKKIHFKAADAVHLPFKDQSFDRVMSGGSTVFIERRNEAFKQYIRVCKPWGMIGELTFFYRRPPPKALLKKLKAILGFNIEPWDKEYWQSFYQSFDLEMYYRTFFPALRPSKKQIVDYATHMSRKRSDLDRATQQTIYEKLLPIMTVFAENHTYLDYGIFVLRKRADQEEPSLFGA